MGGRGESRESLRARNHFSDLMRRVCAAFWKRRLGHLGMGGVAPRGGRAREG